MRTATAEELESVDEVGPVVAESVRAFFATRGNRTLIERLRQSGVDPGGGGVGRHRRRRPAGARRQDVRPDRDASGDDPGPRRRRASRRWEDAWRVPSAAAPTTSWPARAPVPSSTRPSGWASPSSTKRACGRSSKVRDPAPRRLPGAAPHRRRCPVSMLLHANRLTGSIPARTRQPDGTRQPDSQPEQVDGPDPASAGEVRGHDQSAAGRRVSACRNHGTGVADPGRAASRRRPVVHGAAADRTGRQIGMRIPTAGAGAHPPPRTRPVRPGG